MSYSVKNCYLHWRQPTVSALPRWRSYLELAPDGSEARYVQRMLAECERLTPS